MYKRKKEVRDCEYEDERGNLSSDRRYEAKFCTKMCLQETHERTIHESEKCKKSGDSDPSESERTIVSWKEKRYYYRKKNNHYPHKCTKTQHIRRNFFDPFSVLDMF